MNVFDAIRQRRSIKDYRDRPVTRDEIESLLETVVLAPNHRMTEPWEFVVLGPEARRSYGRIKAESRVRRVEDPEAVEAIHRKTIAEVDAIPALIAFVQRLDPDPGVREEDYASLYMGMQNLLLAAVARGLGTHVKTGALLEAPALRELLEVPDGGRVVALVQLGGVAGTREPRSREPAAARTRWLP